MMNIMVEPVPSNDWDDWGVRLIQGIGISNY